LPRQLILDVKISRSMTHLLANFEYVYLSSDWAQQFDKLKWTLTCAGLILWMYSFWHQLINFHCLYFCNSLTLMIILITLNHFNYKLIKLGPGISIRHFLISIQHFLHMYLYHCWLNRQNGLGNGFLATHKIIH